jgi:NTE family protein
LTRPLLPHSLFWMVWAWVRRGVRLGRVLACTALLVGCAQLIHNDPVNQPLSADPALVQTAGHSEDRDTSDDIVVALAFSGGGTRAAAFSYGVLTGLNETRVTTSRGTISLLDHVDFISGVSGGSILAAYFGLYGRQTLSDFPERFLLANPEEHLQTDLSLFNIARGLEGGINDSTEFPSWLDNHLFNHATFRQLLTGRRPAVWINASDIYNRTAFLFTPVTFNALCSDLADYPISLAVAASAAVPVVFAPMVVQNYPGGCPTSLPEWVQRVRSDPNAAPIIKSYAEALERYHTGEVKYVKLLDGGLVDNLGLSGITVTRLANTTAYGPLEPEEAVKLRRLLFLVVDAGRAPSGAWAQSVPGPSGVELISAAADTATESGALSSYLLFQTTMNSWKDALTKWRCHLSEAERRRYGAGPNWNCNDVRFFIGRIAFGELGPERAAALDHVETTLRLPRDQVDMLIAAGHDALQANLAFRGFLQFPPAKPVQRSLPVGASVAHSRQALAP